MIYIFKYGIYFLCNFIEYRQDSLTHMVYYCIGIYQIFIRAFKIRNMQILFSSFCNTTCTYHLYYTSLTHKEPDKKTGVSCLIKRIHNVTNRLYTPDTINTCCFVMTFNTFLKYIRLSAYTPVLFYLLSMLQIRNWLAFPCRC